MNLFIIDTSSKYLYIACAIGDKVFYHYEDELDMKHSETLLVKIDQLLSKNKLSLSDTDIFCACTGPGSFTGIRIGVTTARAFAQIYNKPTMAVNSLELIAYNINKKGIAMPLSYAVNGKYYCAAYQDGKTVMPPAVIKIEDLNNLRQSLIKKYETEEVFFIYPDNIDGVKGIIKPCLPLDYTRYCKQKEKENNYGDYNKLVPEYAALSQAEKEYEDKIRKLC